MKKDFGKKLIATGLAALTMMSATSMFTASVSAAEINTTTAENRLHDAADDAKKARALIESFIGKIPVIGEYAKIEIGPMLDDIFGTTLGNIQTKLDEMNKKLDGISDKIDANTQNLLKQLYKMENLDVFNAKATEVKSICINSKIMFNAAVGSKDSAEQVYYIAKVFDVVNDHVDLLNKVTTMVQYVQGTAVGQKVPLYTASLNVHCKDSVFGGEAATKNAQYVRSINSLFEYSFAVMLSGLDAQKMLGQNYDKVKDFYKNSDDHESGKIVEYANCCHKSLNLIDSYINVVKKMYDSVCNKENKDSITYKYNRFVLDNFTSYIKSTNYDDTQKTVDYIKLSDKIVTKTMDSYGIDRRCSDRYDNKRMIENVTDQINRNLPLNNMLVDIANRMAKDDYYTIDHKGKDRLSFYEGLKLIGFKTDIDGQIEKYVNEHKGATVNDALNNMKCRFVTGGARYEYIASEVAFLMRYGVKGFYKSFDASRMLSGTVGDNETLYYYFHETTGGGGHGIDGDATNYTLMFFQTAK